MVKQQSYSLEDIQKILKAEEFDSAIIEPNDTFPYRRILAFIGTDHKERERILEIILKVQELGQELSDNREDQQEFAKILFQVPFPFPIKEQSIQQIASMLLMLNRYLELPGFEMIEEERKLYYRYVLLTDTDKIDRKICLAIIGIIMVTLDLFTQPIELVASGEMTFNDLLDQVLKLNETLQENG